MISGKQETKIEKLKIDEELEIKVVERRAKSCERLYVDSRIKRLEERNKVDLLIWSNIMNNHFVSKRDCSEAFRQNISLKISQKDDK